MHIDLARCTYSIFIFILIFVIVSTFIGLSVS